jgi:phosphatidyl-myo-inositol dimannoside synthase
VVLELAHHVLLLTPSCGLGGGIERYVETLEWAFSAHGVEFKRIDLCRSGGVAHARMLAQARAHLRSDPRSTRLVLAHRSLLPVASLLARERCVRGVSVICHGSDVWGPRYRPRKSIENFLMRTPDVRAVAVSSYTGGALAGNCAATILPPGLSNSWFRTLVDASASVERGSGINVVTAFRLADWRDKGLPELLEAITALGRPDVHVTICGSGKPSAELLRLVDRQNSCTLLGGLTDRELARQFAHADLFVLATRTRPGRHASGEGFGLVLLEAQVAGSPVVGPAHGGSRDAYVDQVSGLTPTDETAASLADTLDDMLKDPERLAQMGRRAGEWARESFSPARYAARAVKALL